MNEQTGNWQLSNFISILTIIIPVNTMKLNTDTTLVFAVLFIVSFNSSIFSQDAHYSTIQYGTRSTLLGGAVIGSVADLSAAYYNPGAIALFQDPKFILSAKVYEKISYTIEDGVGDGKDLKFSQVTPSPNFAAFSLKFGFLGKDQLAVSILTRHRMVFEFTTRVIDTRDFFPDKPGDEEFAGGLTLKKEFNDVWAGISYATKFSSVIGFGVSTYFSYRDQLFNTQTVLQVLNTDQSISSYSNFSNFSFKYLSAIFKLGLGFDFRPLTMGLTITTPNLGIGGTGTNGYHLFLAGVDLDNNGEDDNRFESNYQDEIEAQYKTPLSIGLGAAYRFGDFRVHLTAEWFDKIDEYLVLDVQDFQAQSSDDIISVQLYDKLQSVTNYGIGLDYFASDDLILSGSYVTDNSAAVSGDEAYLSSSTWHFHHFSGGASFTVGKTLVTLGLAYSFASDQITQLIDLSDDPNSAVVDLEQTSNINLNRIKVLFGFNL